MKLIGIIPAREGSKRLKHKNMYPLKGQPLIEYTINAALNSKWLTLDNLYINTDFDQVKSLANKKNIQVISRPDYLSSDEIWTQEVINHTDYVLGQLDDEDIIVILQANSPQITSEKIDECIEMLIKNNLWQVNTINSSMINNGAIQVIKRKVKKHKGKVNYNGAVQTDWVDVHDVKDIKHLETIL